MLPAEKTVETSEQKINHIIRKLWQESLGNTNARKVTLHFDTNSKSRIEGERPSLILNFLSENPAKCNMVNLRCLFFAHEDREKNHRIGG